jgi:monoamine oxidase
MPPRTIDVAIVGAGAAGLIAAHELLRHGLRVVVLEARNRTGGRILTRRPAGASPVELGAEFVHGDAPLTARLLRGARISAVDVAGEHWSARRGRVERSEYWQPVDRILRRIDAAAPDASFAEFLYGLEMGHVVKLNLRLRAPLGEVLARRTKGDSSLEKLAFLHPGGKPFHVWWTGYPLRDPTAVAWSGGVAAQLIPDRDSSGFLETALAQLSGSSGASPRRLAATIERVDVHDWSADPLARGAYSYTAVGGAGAARSLARPVERTLFFAGEATHETRSGTVEGALASGARAARQIRAALGRS